MAPQVRPGTDRVTPDRIVIVADDLTGACDSGVAFLASGRSVRVVLDPTSFDTDIKGNAKAVGRADVVAFTTETRNLTEQQASARVADYTTALTFAQHQSLIFKKIDSAARGHFGAETVAALEASGAALALVTPAFPQAERTVHSGILSVRDCSGQDTRISLRDQFPAVDPAQIDVLHASPGANLQLGLDRAIANGVRILLCDADTQEDLERLADAGSQLRQRILWAGSAGLARALAKALPAQRSDTGHPAIQREGRILLFSGTPHPVTSLQLSYLREHSASLALTISLIDQESPSKREIHAAFDEEPVAALILTGGDTAYFVLRSLDASSIVLAGEIAPGIPWGFVEGGAADGCVVVTKSGGFGSRDALVEACEFCDRRAYEPA
ncbi:MAG TPA: four-carbon acid sugar kinase family protein [Acidobacteriaceae bacterium]